MKNINHQAELKNKSFSNEARAQFKNQQYCSAPATSGLADLQRSTSDALSQATPWVFSNVDLKVKRHKLDQNTWQLTVVNTKTSKTILQAEGHGDTVFAHEKNLACMAEMLIKQGLKIRTNFDD